MRFTRTQVVEVGAVNLHPDTLDAAREIAPGFDVYALHAEWLGFWEETGRKRLTSPDAAFLGWLKGRATRG